MSEVYAEESVISALLTTDGEIMNDLPMELDASMFADNVYATSFAVFQEAYEKSEKIGLAILQQKVVARSGGVPASFVEKKLRECITGGYVTETVREDAKEIITAYKSRRLNEILNKTSITPDNLDAAMDYITLEIDRLNDRKDSRTKSLAQIVKENKDDYFKDKDKPQAELEFRVLNDMLGGLEAGDMIVIGARPSVGKSAFATQIASHLAETGRKIGYFNLEMTEKQIYERFVSSASGIGLTRIKRAIKYTGDEEERFRKANEMLEKKESIIITTGSQAVSAIQREVKKRNYDLIIIDYLQLIKPEGRYKGNRFAEVGDISHSIKALATDFEIPVVVLSQLNRASVGRENQEPTMSELRESGDIEQDASIILLLWNLDEEGREKGCKVAKNRQGKIGKVTMRFNGDLMKFEEISDADGFIPIEDETPFNV